MWQHLRPDIIVYFHGSGMSQPQQIHYGTSCKEQALAYVYSNVLLHVEWRGRHVDASTTGEYRAVAPT
jgi:hypothetical protein